MRWILAFLGSVLFASVVWLSVGGTGCIDHPWPGGGKSITFSDLAKAMPVSLPIVFLVVGAFSLVHVVIPVAWFWDSRKPVVFIGVFAALITACISAYMYYDRLPSYGAYVVGLTAVAMVINSTQAVLCFLLGQSPDGTNAA